MRIWPLERRRLHRSPPWDLLLRTGELIWCELRADLVAWTSVPPSSTTRSLPEAAPEDIDCHDLRQERGRRQHRRESHRSETRKQPYMRLIISTNFFFESPNPANETQNKASVRMNCYFILLMGLYFTLPFSSSTNLFYFTIFYFNFRSLFEFSIIFYYER